MKNMITLPDDTKVWPRYPRCKHDWREELRKFNIKKPNRSRRARGKARLMFNSLYASDRAGMDAAEIKAAIERLTVRPRGKSRFNEVMKEIIGNG